MQIYNINNMKGGWFIGNFEPSVYKTDQFETCYKIHKAGEHWDAHYHKEAIEINLLIHGVMSINDVIFRPGDIFILDKNEVAVPKFITDCELLIVKTPSVPGDKYLI